MTRRTSTTAASGHFLLRIPPGLHAALRAAALAAGTSLNDYCARKLAAPIGSLAAQAEAGEAVSRAAQLFGDRLMGVAIFGSWSRGELTEGSDIDLLVALDERLPLSRDLYRELDATPLRWQGREVQAHLVQLTAVGHRLSGFWAEAALDGVVLFEREFALSRRFAALRRDIVAGRIVRRTAGGRDYWVEAA